MPSDTPNLATDSSARADLIDIVSALQHVSQSLLSIALTLPHGPRRKAALEGIEGLSERLAAILERRASE